jgi:hypothetical protein
MTAILIRIFLPRFARQYHRSAAQQDGFHLLIRHINAIRCRRSFTKVLIPAQQAHDGLCEFLSSWPAQAPGRAPRRAAPATGSTVPERHRIDESFVGQHLPSGICAHDVR